MIRVLAMIAVAGFVLSVGALSAAVAIGGPEAIARGGWSIVDRDWDGDWNFGWDGHRSGWRDHVRHHRDHDDEGDSGSRASRTLAWSGGDRLEVGLPADIRYVQAAGEGSVTVSGSENAVNRVVVRDGRIEMDGGWHGWPRKLNIVVHAPAVTRFELSGANTLAIEGYRQDRLHVELSGATEMTASGQADAVDLEISGASHADLGELKVKGAEVEISGAGGATVAPTDWARLKISGMGDIRLLTHPPRLDTDISGAGRVRQAGRENVGPLAPAAPTPPAKAKGDRT